MPTYSYQCLPCGPFAAVRRMAEFDQPAACPVCGGESKRMLTVPALLGRRHSDASPSGNDGNDGSDGGKSGAAYQRLAHPAGCACC
jgi:putative FmdB family regulatory protein